MRAVRRVVFFVVAANVIFAAALMALRRALPSQGDEDSDEVALTTIMEGRTLRSRAEAFRGGSILTVTGGTALDLRRAALAPGGAFLEVRTLMGGTTIAVPESWRVHVRKHAVMGAVVDKTNASGKAGGDALTVDALAVMGSIEIGHKLVPMGGMSPADTGLYEGVVPTVV